MTFWKGSSNLKKNHKQFPFWTVGVGIGVVCLIAGFYGDQFTDMYRKAVMICLECIGIG